MKRLSSCLLFTIARDWVAGYVINMELNAKTTPEKFLPHDATRPVAETMIETFCPQALLGFILLTDAAQDG